MDKAFAEASPTTRDAQVFRGVTKLDQIFGDAYSSDLTGTTFTDNGYTSMTIDKEIASNYTEVSTGEKGVLTVDIPAGSNIINPAGVSQWADKELIANRGSTFKVTSDEVVDGIRRLTVRLENPSATAAKSILAELRKLAN